MLFDNGAGGAGARVTRTRASRPSFSRFPIPGTQARSWYLGSGGTLSRRPSPSRRRRSLHLEPARAAGHRLHRHDDGSPGGLWTATPTYHWDQNPPGTAASYVTAPLRSNTVVIGGGAVQLWVKASAPSVDLQVTVSEVRPDGNETFVQNGWLRANERKLDAAQSTLLEPVPSLRGRRRRGRCPKGRYAEVTVPLYYEGHAYRRGSRIRLTVSAPGGDQPVWAFAQTSPRGTAKVSIAPLAALAVAADPAGRPGRQGARPGCRHARGCAASRAAPTSAYANQSQPSLLIPVTRVGGSV